MKRVLFFIFLVVPIEVFAQVIPVPSSPPDGATDQPTTVTLRWVPVLLASSYDVQVATSSDFKNVIREMTGISGTSTVIRDLNNNTTYYWRVRVVILLVPGLWSGVSRFTTVRAKPLIPDPPTLASPSNGSTDQPATITLAWNAVNGADSYHLQVSTNNAFSSLTVNQSSLSQTSYQASDLSFGATYYWRVRAQNSAGSSGWSAIWSFTTKIPLPATPELVAPPNGSTNLPTAQTFDWGDATEANSYTLQVSTESDFDMLVIHESGITTSSKYVEGLTHGTKYFWRVSAQNSYGSSGWSSAWNFSTRFEIPDVPTLVSPLNGAVEQEITLTLRWNSAARAEEYRLQVSLENNFATLFRDDSMITGTSHEVGALDSGRTYYWRVRGKNSSGVSDWSSVWSFMTKAIDSSRLYRLVTRIDFPYRSNMSDYSASDYKIIGLPGESNAALHSLLPGSAKVDWNAYWDNGSSSNYWIEYDGGPNFVFSLGRAFWILKRGDWTINVTVPRPQQNAQNEIEIPLHDGWNLITDPLMTNVPWQSVQQRNGTSELLYAFINGAYSASEILAPFVGYYFFNDSNLSTLRIPVNGAGEPTPGYSEIKSSHSSDWRVNVIVRSGNMTDDALWFGTKQNASDVRDESDVHKPEAVSGAGSYFYRPQWDNQYSRFATDIRPPVESEQRWEIRIDVKERNDLRISFSGIKQVPNDLDLWLVNEQSGVKTNLRSIHEYTITPQSDLLRYTVRTVKKGTPTTVLKSKQIPKSYYLEQNFPNPFNPSTTIRFGIPHSGNVSLRVYDLLGRTISSLVDVYLESGTYNVNFDGTAFPSGIYLYTLETGEINLSRRFILQK
ncbi:MAG: T9SS type A sorting domain-containing protein [Bacteroidota bacterium]